MSLERFQLDRLLIFGEYWGLNRDRCWVQVMLWVRVCGQQGTGKLPLVVEVERVVSCTARPLSSSLRGLALVSKSLSAPDDVAWTNQFGFIQHTWVVWLGRVPPPLSSMATCQWLAVPLSVLLGLVFLWAR